ncbi:putative MscS family protein [Golovinomyces cichoracearum]|uniref:Putative MscS family protein n=1 Tax=Golovinomyces cichoracearum TaxID=62708 RepID=A0A420IGX8_9PEZI|nr:putative MscS family protein [Golovinomyces cichoracearum]
MTLPIESNLPKPPTLFSRNGFLPLVSQKLPAPIPNMGFDVEGNIPLTKIQSSSTGARKPGEGALNDYPQESTFKVDEKHGWSGRRKAKEINPISVQGETDSEPVEVNNLGRLYKRIVRFSLVTRYFVYIVPVALLIAVPLITYEIYKPNELFVNTGVRVRFFWIWIEIVWLSLWGSKLASRAMPHIFVTLSGVVNAGIRKYAAILHAVQLQLTLVCWTVISLVTFTGLMNPGVNRQLHQKHWISVVKNFLGASLVSSLLYLAEKMFVQLISINYHRRSFDNRIRENKLYIRLLSHLYEASCALFPPYCQEFLEEDSIVIASIRNKLNKARERRSGTATPLRIVGEIGRFGNRVTAAFGNIASEVTGKQIFSTQSAQSIVSEALKKVDSSEALAKRLWMSFVLENNEVLYADDIKEVLGPARQEQANECFAVLDTDGNGDISLDEMILKVVKIGRDRKAITASMRDVGQAISVLDQVLVTIVSVIIIFTFVAFQHASFVTTLATAGTTLLSLSFVFAVTTQEFLGSCIFLFVKHPYDVGDRCDLNNTAVVVEQISLLFTVFKRIDTMRLVQIPNMVLNTLWIDNITRSKAMKEQLEIFISFDTPLEDIETLRMLMESFVRHPDNSHDFQPDILIETTGINSMDKLSLKIEICHKSNWHNENVRAARRSKFMCALIIALRKVPIHGPGGDGDDLGGPSNPGYTVSVTDQWAANARNKSSDEKESKRFIPISTGVKTSENQSQPDLKMEPEAPEDQIKKGSKKEKSSAIEKSDENEDTFEAHLRSENDQRTCKIESLRQGLLKRQSTRGRRRPGEAMQSISQIHSDAVSLAANNPVSNSQMVVNQNSDEENQIGMYRNLRQDQVQQHTTTSNLSQWPAQRDFQYPASQTRPSKN